ncbi:MAG: hypothetical protein LBK56_00045 [Gracilibacteraceae bacterium]|jgi:hypothetical protein|nr:hypothetical protein [Gracilibacteraceae bacterium]
MQKQQVKIYAEPELATAFKALCEKSGTSMTAELSAYMRKRLRLKEPTLSTGSRTETDKRWRRKAIVREMIDRLENVCDAEESYRDSIPENLSGGPLAEAADEAVSKLTEAIEILSDVYTL